MARIFIVRGIAGVQAAYREIKAQEGIARKVAHLRRIKAEAAGAKKEINRLKGEKHTARKARKQ